MTLIASSKNVAMVAECVVPPSLKAVTFEAVLYQEWIE